jgi:hypothetical protein
MYRYMIAAHLSSNCRERQEVLLDDNACWFLLFGLKVMNLVVLIANVAL